MKAEHRALCCAFTLRLAVSQCGKQTARDRHQNVSDGNVRKMLEPVHICFQNMDEKDILITESANEDSNVDVFDVSSSSPSEAKTEEFNFNSENDGPNLNNKQLILDNPKTTLEKLHRKANIPPLILMETDGNFSAPFQFDRQAPGRISTSPTLRRLRKNTIGNYTSLQDVFDVSKFPIHKEESVVDDVSCVPPDVEDTMNTYDHLVDPALHTNFTDDEKSPDNNHNGTAAMETKEEPEIPIHCAK
ncbi:unnamed protein product, partial [Ranitomeya imitator]